MALPRQIVVLPFFIGGKSSIVFVHFHQVLSWTHVGGKCERVSQSPVQHLIATVTGWVELSRVESDLFSFDLVIATSCGLSAAAFDWLSSLYFFHWILPHEIPTPFGWSVAASFCRK